MARDDLTQIDDVRAFIANARWIFARTMPAAPHWYTLRKENPQAVFETFVMLIRECGHRERYRGRALWARLPAAAPR